MAWVGVATGAASVVSGVFGGKDSGDSGDAAAAAQAKVMEKQLEFQKQVYADQWGIYKPIAEQLSSEVTSPGSLDWDVNSDAIKQQYASANRDTVQKLNDQGVSSDSGTAQALIAGNQIKQAQDLSKQWATGVMNKRQLAASMLGAGTSATISAANGTNAAASGLASAYGAQAANYYNQALSASNAISNGLGLMAYSWQH